MDVDDAFEVKKNFSTPKVHAVRFYGSASGRENTNMGTLNSSERFLRQHHDQESALMRLSRMRRRSLKKADELLSNSAG